MKKEIHPKYHADAKIICACGNIIETGSTVKEMKIEICSACHPFYTGKKRSMDTTGRVDRFKKLAEKSAKKKTVKKATPAKTSKKEAVKPKKPTAKKK